MVGPETVVVSIQNGLGGPDRAAEMLGDERVAIGVVGGFGASIVEPGHVHSQRLGQRCSLGERNGPVTPRIEQVAEVWRDAGFKVQTYDDVGTLVWEKLVCNTAFSGTCALLELTVGEVLESEEAFAEAGGCASETFAVARASGIQLGLRGPRRVRQGVRLQDPERASLDAARPDGAPFL